MITFVLNFNNHDDGTAYTFSVEADTKEEAIEKGHVLYMRLRRQKHERDLRKERLKADIIKKADDFSYNLNPFEFSPEEWQQIRNNKDINNRIYNINAMNESDFDSDTLTEFQEIKELIADYQML